MNLNNGSYQENLSYDVNGNIKTLFRTGKKLIGYTAAELMDDLTYHYENTEMSNKLLYIKEGNGNALSGYPLAGGAIGKTIIYDANGNMTSENDKNITAIAYNFLNLPNQVTQSGAITNYVYRADGTKLQKKIGTKITDYLGGFQYQNNALQFFPTAEGYYDYVNKRYVYNYVDHLGNVRLSYFKGTNGEAVTDRESNYYPFGLEQTGYGYDGLAGNTSYNYKYNGKELQETGMYEYGARMYMPDIGRWGVQDLLSELYYSHSPYNYVGNNPIIKTDKDGLYWVLRMHDGNYEAYYDRDVKTQKEADKKYGENAVQIMGSGSTLSIKDADGKLLEKYTFTNDEKENKDGTVKDINDKVLDNTKIKYGESYTIFGTCDSCVNAETLYKNYMGTTYTGPNNPKAYDGTDSYQFMPKNLSEYGSMGHDREYDRKNASGINGALFNTSVRSADLKLAVYNFINALANPNLTEKARSIATSETFFGIFMFKQIITQQAVSNVGINFPKNK